MSTALRLPNRRRTSPMRQWSALSGRSIAGGIRDGDLFFAACAPVIFFVCFYVPLRNMMRLAGIDYAQYLLPVIVLQSMLFTAMAAGDRSAGDNLAGMGARLRALPVPGLIPMWARMSANMTRAVISMAGALAVGFAFGFRLRGGPVETLGFFGLALLFGLALSFAADAFGALSRSREAASQVLLVPQLLLTMLSTGMMPASAFTGWLQPFVRNQPVSKVAEALRELATGGVDTATAAVAVVWCVGLLMVFVLVATRIDRRER